MTSWYGDTTTKATINSELLTMFGSDAESSPIFEANPTGHQEAQISGPLYNRNMILHSTMVRSTNDDHEEYGLPDWLSSPVTLPREVVKYSPRVSLEFRNFSRERTHQLGAINWHDGSAIWQRNFGKNNAAKQVLRASLHDGRLHVLSVKQCAEDLGGITLAISMTQTGDSSLGWTVTITLTITNTRPNSVVVDDTDISVAVSPSSPVTWSPSTRTITAGSNATFTGSFATFTAGTYTASGTVDGEDQATSETLTSNEATDSVILT